MEFPKAWLVYSFWTIIVTPVTGMAESSSKSISANEYFEIIGKVFDDSSNGTTTIHQFRHDIPEPGILGKIVKSSVNGSILNPEDSGIWDPIPCFFPKTDRIVGEYPNAPRTDGWGDEQVPDRYKMGDHYDSRGPLAYFLNPNFAEQKSRIMRFLDWDLMKFRPSSWLRELAGISSVDIEVTDYKGPRDKLAQRTIEVTYSDKFPNKDRRVTGQKITLIASELTGEWNSPEKVDSLSCRIV